MASVFNKKTQFGNKQFGEMKPGFVSAEVIRAFVRDKKAARRISYKKRGGGKKMTLKGKFAGMKIEMCKVDEEQRQIKAKWRLQNG